MVSTRCSVKGVITFSSEYPYSLPQREHFLLDQTAAREVPQCQCREDEVE